MIFKDCMALSRKLLSLHYYNSAYLVIYLNGFSASNLIKDAFSWDKLNPQSIFWYSNKIARFRFEGGCKDFQVRIVITYAKITVDMADSELSQKLARQQQVNEGEVKPVKVSQSVYAEFKEFSIQEIKEYRKVFQK